MKNMIKYVKTYLILIIIFLLCLTITSLIPSKLMKSNVQKSANTLKRMGPISKYIDYELVDLILFRYTDALMINTAYSIDSETPLYSFMVARRNYLPKLTKKIYSEDLYDLSSIQKYYKENKLESGDIRRVADQVNELYDTAYDDIEESVEYARYWHGYLCFLRPLLVIFDYNAIMVLSTIIFAIILSVFTYLMSKRTSFLQTIPFLIGFILVGGFIVSMSMNEITCFYIAYIASIYILLKFDKIKNMNLIFFIIGAVTNFIDFFTNPIITLGIPMLVYTTVLQKEKELTLKQTIIQYIKSILSWGIGFSVTWISKWVIVDILYNKGILKNAITQALFRSVSYGLKEKVTFEGALFNSLSFLGIIPIMFIILIPLVYVFIPIKRHNANINKGLPYILISLMPFLWMIILTNHTAEHPWFTCRNFYITITGIQLLLISQIKIAKKK